MPVKQVDLEPHEFRSERSKRNANLHGLMALAGAAMLAFVWWHRAELTADTLFWGTVALSLPTGGGLIVFLNQWRGV